MSSSKKLLFFPNSFFGGSKFGGFEICPKISKEKSNRSTSLPFCIISLSIISSWLPTHGKDRKEFLN
jgi:hypothetical protein